MNTCHWCGSTDEVAPAYTDINGVQVQLCITHAHNVDFAVHFATALLNETPSEQVRLDLARFMIAKIEAAKVSPVLESDH